MDFELPPAHAELRDLSRKVAEERVAPFAAEVDRVPRYPKEAFAGLREDGILGVSLPEEAGGLGLGTLGLVLATEEVAKYCASTGLVLTLARLATAPFMLEDSDEQRRRDGGLVARGKGVGSFALTEPLAGSDVGAMATRAERQRDGSYRLTERKSWVSQCREAAFITVFARTGEGSRGVSAFVVERDTGGLSVGPPTGKMGVRGVGTGDVVLESAAVPEGARVGQEGDGF